MKVIENQSFDSERALYESRGVRLIDCAFQGKADGESALKESSDIVAQDCFFDLRYPFWHDKGVKIIRSKMTENCRAPLWYSTDVELNSCDIFSVKAIRECDNVKINGCKILSVEAGWDCRGVEITDTEIDSAYFMMRSRSLSFKNMRMKGKYSFQYIEDAVLDNCQLDTKDAFWHGKNVTVKNSVIKGEYLGWYSENLTFENCVITGTQPLCYCRGLKLINCEMHSCDLAFEKSWVEAEITTPVISIKNVYGGKITAPAVSEIISFVILRLFISNIIRANFAVFSRIS